MCLTVYMYKMAVMMISSEPNVNELEMCPKDTDAPAWKNLNANC